MQESVYPIIELVGSPSTSWDDAANNVIVVASESLWNLTLQIYLIKKNVCNYVVNLYAIELACMELGEVALLYLFDTGIVLIGFFMAITLLIWFVIFV